MDRRRRGLGSGVVAVALVLGMALLAWSQASAVSPTVSIDSVTVASAEDAAVELEALDIAAPGLGGWTIDVIYDPAVVTPLDCTSHQNGFCNVGFASDTVRVTGASAGGMLGDSVLADITFRCIAEGSTTLTPVIGELADATVRGPLPITAAVQAGSIACLASAPALLGDTDCNGLVNSIDAALVLQLVADLIDSVPCAVNADVDENGRINSVDAALILQIDAGLWSPGA